MDKCPVCDAQPRWPVVDTATGWTFCLDCFGEVHRVKTETAWCGDAFARWLQSIVHVRIQCPRPKPRPR